MEQFDHAPCGFIRLTKEGVILYINETLLNWLGREMEGLINQHFEKLLSPVGKVMIYSYFYPTIFTKGKVEEMVLKLNHNQGVAHSYILNARKLEKDSIEYIDCALIQMDKRMNYEEELRIVRQHTNEALKEKEEAFNALEKIYEEIEEKQKILLEINNKLQEKSTIDFLTGLYNRSFFNEFMKLQIQQFVEDKNPFSLIIADIDFFKKVNDSYGHIVGDVVLSKVAQLFKESLPKDAIVSRFGGEEFVVVLPKTEQDEAIKVAKSLNRRVSKQYFEQVGHITISLGVSTVQMMDTLETILERADEALYYVKRNGRNNVFHYDDFKEELG